MGAGAMAVAERLVRDIVEVTGEAVQERRLAIAAAYIATFSAEAEARERLDRERLTKEYIERLVIITNEAAVNEHLKNALTRVENSTAGTFREIARKALAAIPTYPHSFTGAEPMKPTTGLVYATKKTKRAPSFMPDEVIVTVAGEPKGRLLMTCGWTVGTHGCKRWPLARLKGNLRRLEAEWAADFGKSWRLEIR